MKRISLLILLVCVVFSLLTVVSFADEPSLASEAETAATEEKTASWSETVTAWLSENIESIFSGAAFGGVAILMFLFKKGLLPAVSGAIVKVGDSVSAAKDKLNEVASGIKGEMDGFIEKFSPILEKLDGYTDFIEKALEEVRASKNEKELLVSALEENSKLLVNMISASRLPESVKEAARLTKAKHDSLVESLRGSSEGGEAE